MSKNIHTVYNSSKTQWENKEEGNSKPLSTHIIKSKAVEKGREFAIANKSEHFIHNMDGKISEKNSYGNDDYPPKG